MTLTQCITASSIAHARKLDHAHFSASREFGKMAAASLILRRQLSLSAKKVRCCLRV